MVNETINLGQVAGIVKSPNIPSNQNVIWAKQLEPETDPDKCLLHTYDGVDWRPLGTRMIGELLQTTLDLADAQFQLGNDADNWIEADGSDVTGSTWSQITGETTVPDLTGNPDFIYLIKIN